VGARRFLWANRHFDRPSCGGGIPLGSGNEMLVLDLLVDPEFGGGLTEVRKDRWTVSD